MITRFVLAHRRIPGITPATLGVDDPAPSKRSVQATYGPWSVSNGVVLSAPPIETVTPSA